MVLGTLTPHRPARTRLRNWRVKRGLTMEQMGQAIGKTRVGYLYIESARTKSLSYDTVAALKALTGLKAEDINYISQGETHGTDEKA